jgi:hypothetical protein
LPKSTRKTIKNTHRVNCHFVISTVIICLIQKDNYADVKTVKQLGEGAVTPGAKRPERDDDHKPTPTVEIKNACVVLHVHLFVA